MQWKQRLMLKQISRLAPTHTLWLTRAGYLRARLRHRSIIIDTTRRYSFGRLQRVVKVGNLLRNRNGRYGYSPVG